MLCNISGTSSDSGVAIFSSTASSAAFSAGSSSLVRNYQMYKYEMRIKKKHVKYGKMIKRALFKVCSIASYTFFPSFGQFVDTTSVKIFPLCHSSSYFFTSSYEPKRCSVSA